MSIFAGSDNKVGINISVLRLYAKVIAVPSFRNLSRMPSLSAIILKLIISLISFSGLFPGLLWHLIYSNMEDKSDASSRQNETDLCSRAPNKWSN